MTHQDARKNTEQAHLMCDVSLFMTELYMQTTLKFQITSGLAQQPNAQ